MSCLAPKYNPKPTRQWSRVQNLCTFEIANTQTSNYTYIPQLKKFVLNADVYSTLNMLRKGNILQYKANSSNITKQQQYSQISKGMQTTNWASQSDKYTDPNTNMLKRVNVITNITLDGVATSAPTTCPIDVLKDPNITVVIADGGSLVYNIMENPCTGQIINKQSNNGGICCAPTTSSNVPGPIMNLCYNSGIPTYIPRTRTVMSNSGNKWPQGVKMLVSANGIKSAI